MTYEQALDYLYKQLPMYQNEGKSAYKKDLNNTKALCNILDNPQQKFKSIHIAGTNGKGSSAHMLASVFQEAGYKTGLYTSPHLKDFKERIRINGETISNTTVLNFIERYISDFDKIKPSFFEWTVALAFQIFAKEKVDIAIIETGLGGRLDSTNVINPELCLITNIGFDHVEMLGDTLEAIAREKAGIIKRNTPVVISQQSKQKEVFEQIALQNNAPIHFAEELNTNCDLKTDLVGSYQKSNILGVLQCWAILRLQGWQISFKQLQTGLLNVTTNTKIRGRWEILSHNPTVIADTAHNKEGLCIALNQLGKTNAKHLHFVIGFVNDKNLDDILELFPKNATYYFCQANVQRALNAEDLKRLAKKYKLTGESYESVSAALNEAKEKANSDDVIYVGGSTFVVAEAI